MPRREQPPKYTPTPAQIRRECEAIQETWTPEEAARRAGKRRSPLSAREMQQPVEWEE